MYLGQCQGDPVLLAKLRTSSGCYDLNPLNKVRCFSSHFPTFRVSSLLAGISLACFSLLSFVPGFCLPYFLVEDSLLSPLQPHSPPILAPRSKGSRLSIPRTQ